MSSCLADHLKSIKINDMTPQASFQHSNTHSSLNTKWWQWITFSVTQIKRSSCIFLYSTRTLSFSFLSSSVSKRARNWSQDSIQGQLHPPRERRYPVAEGEWRQCGRGIMWSQWGQCVQSSRGAERPSGQCLPGGPASPAQETTQTCRTYDFLRTSCWSHILRYMRFLKALYILQEFMSTNVD